MPIAMWANHIETGTLTLSANDLAQQNRHNEIKSLNALQITTVTPLRKLALQELRNDKTLSRLAASA
jgi:hypothetical protein